MYFMHDGAPAYFNFLSRQWWSKNKEKENYFTKKNL